MLRSDIKMLMIIIMLVLQCSSGEEGLCWDEFIKEMESKYIMVNHESSAPRRYQLILTDDRETFTDCQETCRKEKGDLVHKAFNETEQEDEYVQYLRTVVNCASQDLWIGMKKGGEVLEWIDESAFPADGALARAYHLNISSAPDGCGYIDQGKDELLIDEFCGTKPELRRRGICEVLREEQ